MLYFLPAALVAFSLPHAPLRSRAAVRATAASMAESCPMDPAVLERYMKLPGAAHASFCLRVPTLAPHSRHTPMAHPRPQPCNALAHPSPLASAPHGAVSGKIQAEYLWIDADGDVRSKCRTVDKAKSALSQLPNWNYDGSSCAQAPGDDSEVIVKPRAVFPDPFRGGDNILVLTDTYTPGGTPLPTNYRAPASEIFGSSPEASGAWFGLEQEYTLFNIDKVTPLGWPVGGYPGEQGPYYCGAGADRSFGRSISEAHYRACLYAKLDIAGTNAEVMPGQWEYQIGPCVGLDAGDQMMVSRYILQRVCEDFGVYCTLDPKPIPGEWNGAGCHTNFSTEKMRKSGGCARGAAV